MTAVTLLAAFGSDRLRAGQSLAEMATFRIGGPADWLLDVYTAAGLRAAIRAAADDGLAVTVLGGGSNVLVGDGDVRGLVVRPRHSRIERVEPDLVRADAGATLNGLVRWTVREGLGGLEAWAGTPGTVGGALCGNATGAGDSSAISSTRQAW